MSFGTELKAWREIRRFSQLHLATEAAVSQRHLSFLETGRSRPSREMVLHLARTLEVPLDGQNRLLLAAGLAPAFPARALEDVDLAPVRRSLDFMLTAHEPNPAVVVDRAWNLLLSNTTASALTPRLVDPATAPVIDGRVNLIRLTLHPDGLSGALVNFDEVAAALVHRLEDELRMDPFDEELRALHDEVLGYPDIPDRADPGVGGVLVPLHYRTDDLEVRLFTTIATLGSPLDATLAGIRLETFFPADEASAAVLADL